MKNLNLSQNTEIIPLEKFSELARELTDKYKLEKEIEEEREVKERLKRVEDPLVREGIKFLYSKEFVKKIRSGGSLDELTPFRKLRKIIGELSKNKISLEELPLILQQRLDISSKTSKELTKDIEKRLSFLIKESPPEAEKKEPPKILEEKKASSVSKEVSPIKEKGPRKDIYREPIK